MKWTALIKLMILCLVVLGMSIFSNDLLRGMDKAEIGK